MSQLFGLFSSQREAGKAVEALGAANLDESVIHTMDKENANTPPPPIAAPTLHVATDVSAGSAVPLMPDSSELDFGNLDDDLKAYIQRGVQRGGVVIAITPPDEDTLQDAERILKERGGHVVGVAA